MRTDRIAEAFMNGLYKRTFPYFETLLNNNRST